MQRDENKLAFLEAGVGDFETGFADRRVVEEENVEVERARAVFKALCAIAAKRFFNQQQRAQQLKGRQLGFKPGGGVYKAGLVGIPHRRGGVERRSRPNPAHFPQARGSGSQSGVRQASLAGQVRAQSDVAGFHRFQRNANGRRTLDEQERIRARKRFMIAVTGIAGDAGGWLGQRSTCDRQLRPQRGFW